MKNFLKYDDVLLYNAHINAGRPEVLSKEHKLEVENLLRNNTTASLETLIIELKKKNSIYLWAKLLSMILSI